MTRAPTLPLGSGLLAAVLAGCAAVPPVARLDSLNLGRNALGEACAASRSWNDPGAPDAFSRAYLLTCSGVASNRPLGTMRVVARSPEALAAVDRQFDCGSAAAIRTAGGEATARRCLDRLTGIESVRVDAVRGHARFVAAGAPSLLPQLEEWLAIASGDLAASADVTRTPAAAIDLAAIPARPGAAGTEAAVAEIGSFNVAGALAQGIELNHKGLHVEASRVLNDALSRLSSAAPPAVRAELLLEAGIADSNILFAEAAQGHFAAADKLFDDAPAARSVFLLRKRDGYRALDALNRHAFPEALALLDRAAGAPASDQPLRDAETLRLLNQPRARGVAGALAVPDAARLAQYVLDAQAQYARSIAYLSQGDVARATAAIDAAAAAIRPLSGKRFDQNQLLWLDARITRQRGRLQARRGDFREALESYNDAVDMLRRGSVANAGTGAEPAVAEAELERAAVFARTNASRDAVREAFAGAVDAMVASGAASLGASIGMEDYLDLLVREAATAPRADTFDRFMRAVQANGEPAVARQLVQLRDAVTADPALAAAVRERADLERELTRLRYAITARTEGEASPAADLESARAAAERRLTEVDARLAADPRYRTLDESPAPLAELRAALRPGESFIKLTELNSRVYGLVVTADRTFIYHVAESEAATKAVGALADQLRGSIDGGLATGQLVPFDEARAYALFRLVAGPAAEALASSRTIVVDPAGPLDRLPIGVLVTRYDPATTRADPFDFSQTAFLAGSTSISTALSPRSFLVARALPPSKARNPLLGLGEHRAAAFPGAVAAARPVRVGFGCTVDYGRLATLSRALKPISRRELGIAAGALGVSTARALTGADFSDTGLEARSDLDEYEVLHFATHGLEEGVWGCSKSPPALVTSFGGAGSDGLLDFSEIAGLRLDANLVVLSACDTAAGVRDEALARASGQEEVGSTLDGLVRAFLTANARAVLATYWQVSAERESDEFIRAFYARGRTGTMGEALQDAQRALMTRPAYSHPFYWAPYFLVGDSSKTMLTGAPAQVARR